MRRQVIVSLFFLTGVVLTSIHAEIRQTDPDILARWTFGNNLGEIAQEGASPEGSESEMEERKGVLLDVDQPTLPLEEGGETVLGGQFSVSAWVKPNTVFSEPASPQNVHPSDSGIGSVAPIRLGMVGNRLRLTVRDREGKPVVMETVGELEPGRWNLVTFVADDGQFRVYVDEEAQLVGRVPDADFEEGNEREDGVRIGDVVPQVESRGMEESFSGVVDEVTVFKRALSEEEVQKISAAASNGFAPDSESPATEGGGVDPVVVVSVFVLVFFVGFGLVMGRRG
jgi:hypothetical protein